MSVSESARITTPLPLLVVTADPAPYLRVLPRCPDYHCVGVMTVAEAQSRLSATPVPLSVLIGADVPPDDLLSLLGRARQQGFSACLADSAAIEPEVGQDLQQAFSQAGLSLQLGHPLRHRPMVEPVHTALREGQLGEPGILRVHDWQSAREPGGIPPGWEWRSLRQWADLVVWLLGKAPDTVWATRPRMAGDAGVREASVETVQIHCGGPGAAMVLIDLAHGLPTGDDYWSLSLIGSRGAAYADDHRNRQLLFGGGTARAECTREGDWPLLQLVRSFSTSPGWPGDRRPTANGSQPPNTTAGSSPAFLPGITSLQTAALVKAIRHSLQTNESVRVPQDGAA